MHPSATPYHNANAYQPDGFLRDGPSSGGGGGDFFRLHRDYLQGLDSNVVKKLPWPTVEQKMQVDSLLQKRSWAILGWTRGFTGVVYSALTSIIVIFLFVPKIRRDDDNKDLNREWLRIVGICLAGWNAVLILGVGALYVYYSTIDQQIQKMVRQLMDETGIGAAKQVEHGTMRREDASQQAIFELPEFINIMWQRASFNPSAGPSASDQVSTITFG